MITVAEQLKCVEREIGFRKRVYPKWVEAGKMAKVKAEYEIKVMESIKQTLILMPQYQAFLEVK